MHGAAPIRLCISRDLQLDEDDDLYSASREPMGAFAIERGYRPEQCHQLWWSKRVLCGVGLHHFSECGTAVAQHSQRRDSADRSRLPSQQLLVPPWSISSSLGSWR